MMEGTKNVTNGDISVANSAYRDASVFKHRLNNAPSLPRRTLVWLRESVLSFDSSQLGNVVSMSQRSVSRLQSLSRTQAATRSLHLGSAHPAETRVRVKTSRSLTVRATIDALTSTFGSQHSHRCGCSISLLRDGPS